MITTGAVRKGAAWPVNEVRPDAPWDWIARGFWDFVQAPVVSLVYGVGFVAVSLIISAGLWRLGLGAWIPAAVGGFLIVGPLVAVGLYETARRLETGEPVSVGAALIVTRAARLQLVYMGFLLMFLYLVWLRVAMLLYAIFALGQYEPLSDFISHTLTTTNGLALLGVGTAIGAVIAFTSFALSAISVPMLMAERVDFATAVLTSVEAVKRNFGPMLLWAWIIALSVAFGAATLFVGLAVVFPVIGYATWHAYRALVSSSG
jgi:uncharacterized membrane protein